MEIGHRLRRKAIFELTRVLTAHAQLIKIKFGKILIVRAGLIVGTI